MTSSVCKSPAADSDFELRQLLAESVVLAQARGRSTFDQLTAPCADRLVLFGAGLMGRRALQVLRRAGIEPLAFADSNPSQWGTSLDGLEILAPETAAERFANCAAFVVTVFSPGPSYRAIRQQLLDLRCRTIVSVIPFLWKYAEQLLPYFFVDLPHKLLDESQSVMQGLSLWADAASRREYVAQVRLRLWQSFESLAVPTPEEQYFPDGLFRLQPEEVFVDCGAFIGDTLAQFVERSGGRFAGLVAIEPDPKNFGSLRRRVRELEPEVQARVTLLCAAVGAQRAMLRFDATGTGAASVSESGALEVDCRPLDELLCGQRITYLKMDVEGAERDAILGAQQVIQRDLPILAISVYHKPADLWQIPLLIRSLSSQYCLFLRPHYEIMDLVCYAIPPTRVIPVAALGRLA